MPSLALHLNFNPLSFFSFSTWLTFTRLVVRQSRPSAPLLIWQDTATLTNQRGRRLRPIGQGSATFPGDPSFPATGSNSENHSRGRVLAFATRSKQTFHLFSPSHETTCFCPDPLQSPRNFSLFHFDSQLALFVCRVHSLSLNPIAKYLGPPHLIHSSYRNSVTSTTVSHCLTASPESRLIISAILLRMTRVQPKHSRHRTF